MAEIARLNGARDWIDLEFVERERTPASAMRLGIRLHLAELSLSNIVSDLEMFGVDRHRTTVHKWVHKAEFEPAAGCDPAHVAVDETVIHLNGDQFWLFAAVDVTTNRLLHVRLFPTRPTVTSRMFLADLREKHQADDTLFLVDSAPWLHAALDCLGLRFRHRTHGRRNSVERVFRKVKRRTRQFSNTFRHVGPPTAESWLQAFTVRHNALI